MNKYVENNLVGSFTFAGKNTYKDFGLVVQTVPNYEVAAREQTSTKIIGRNGDIVDVTGSFSNVTRSYSLVLYYENNDNMDYVKNADYETGSGYNIHKTDAKNSTFIEKARKIISWLKSVKGYSFLIDTYDPKVYRKAVLKSADVVTNIYDQAIAITVEFMCRPERYEYKNVLPNKAWFSPFNGEPTGDYTNFDNKEVSVKKPFDTDAYPRIIIDNPAAGSTSNLHIKINHDVYRLGDFFTNIPSYIRYIVVDFEKKYTYGIDSSNNLINLNKYVDINFPYPPIIGNKGDTIYINVYQLDGNIQRFCVVYNWWCL